MTGNIVAEARLCARYRQSIIGSSIEVYQPIVQKLAACYSNFSWTGTEHMSAGRDVTRIIKKATDKHSSSIRQR